MFLCIILVLLISDDNADPIGQKYGVIITFVLLSAGNCLRCHEVGTKFHRNLTNISEARMQRRTQAEIMATL